MFRSALRAVQLKEDLLLDNEPKFFVSHRIAQYLLNHQLNGIRFMFRHFKNSESAILNDIDGAGKCFQCVAFFDAIFRSLPGSHILVICERKQDLDHWHYHIDGLLNNLTVLVADKQRESQIGQSTSSLNKITLVSSAYALEHINQINAEPYIYLVLHDPYMQLTAGAFAKLKAIQVPGKLVSCNRDIVENLSYFYEVLKFCNHDNALLAAGSKTIHLTKNEFKLKYGDDRSIPKRNQIFRQRNLLNACNDFYLRRIGNNMTNHYPPIDAQVFRKNFETWKETVNLTTVQTMTCDDSSVSERMIEMLQTQKDNDNSQIDENSTSLLNTASIDLDDFDTQMSPLIYSDSDAEENENHINVNRNVIPSSSESSEQTSSIIIACNQEHAAKNLHLAQSLKSTVKRNYFDKSTTNNNKRMNYKQLSVTINSSRVSKLSNIKKVRNELSTLMTKDDGDDEIQCLINERSRRRISSTSDVQIISDRSSPITISSNSTTDDSKNVEQLEKNKSEIETQFTADEPSSSPDLFSSFNTTRTEIPDENLKKNKQPKTLQDLFGAPDECDDIDLSTHSNVDVFEITKNNVFENILCSAKNRITPTIQPNEMRPACTTVKCASNRNCLSGLRIVLPKLDERQVERIRNELQSQSNSQVIEMIAKPVDVIDLTSTQNDIDNLIDSDFIGQNIERTPDKKQELTPSTRSCLKRSSTCDDKTDDEKRRRIPLDDAGWISIKRSPSATGTPHSRRRLEKWLNRTRESETSDHPVKVSKPRNLCKEFKSRANSRKRGECTSSTTDTQSPNIFSDPDD